MPDALSSIKDSRPQPRISTTVVVKSAFSMFLGRLGSLNALEQLKHGSRILSAFIEADLPSADTIGRVFSLIDADTIRHANWEIYTQLKRNKAFEVLAHGLIPVNIDGHESHATYNRCCEGCLERTMNKGTDSEKIQYYHRHVAAQLVFENFYYLLDIEQQCPGEDERAAAKRLLERVLKKYPRGFDVVVADAMFCGAPFINFVIDSGKDIVVVAKDDRFDIVKDANGFFHNKPPSIVTSDPKVERQCWDAEGFEWSEVKQPFRVVKTVETKTVRRQLRDKTTGLRLVKKEISSWMWITTLPTIRANTEAVVKIGHDRWKIENNGFNEMVNHWFSDHVYKHHATAMLNFWLVCMMANNVFHCFYLRNLKAAVQKRYTMLHVAQEVKLTLYERSTRATRPP